MSNDSCYVYGGAYADLADAQVDFDSVKSFYDQGVITGYEAAVFTKEADGSVKIVNTETPRRAHGAIWGALTGTVIGLVFPVTFLVGAPIAAATAGGTIVANWSKSFGRDDIRKMGEALDPGASGVVVVASLSQALPVDRLLTRATSTTAHPIEDAKAVHDALKDQD